jgi:hypothetical protein
MLALDTFYENKATTNLAGGFGFCGLFVDAAGVRQPLRTILFNGCGLNAREPYFFHAHLAHAAQTVGNTRISVSNVEIDAVNSKGC